MSRQIKGKHTAQLITAVATGYTGETFASPRLVRAARADRGHTRMTGPEYAAHRMGRGQMPTCRLELTLELRGRLHRQQRTVGGRRVTGRQAGTKRPLWSTGQVQRERTAR